jgi:hypothetical protein
MRIWRDYKSGTLENGQRAYFYFDDDFCFRAAKRVNNVVTFYGPGYVDYWSNEVKVPQEEFASWDANWLKRIS